MYFFSPSCYLVFKFIFNTTNKMIATTQLSVDVVADTVSHHPIVDAPTSGMSTLRATVDCAAAEQLLVANSQDATSRKHTNTFFGFLNR